MVIGLIPVDLPLFVGLTRYVYISRLTMSFLSNMSRYGTFQDLRFLSVDALLILNGLKNPEVCSFFLHLLAHDPDPRMRYHVATSLARIFVLRPLNQDEARVRDPQNYWSFVDPPHLASRVFGKVLWSLLTYELRFV
jgi:hypothetical protein